MNKLKIPKALRKGKFGLKGNKETYAYIAVGGIGLAMLYFILTAQKSGIGIFDQIAGGIGSASRLEGRGAGVLPNLPGGLLPTEEGVVKESAYTDWYQTTESQDDRLIIA